MRTFSRGDPCPEYVTRVRDCQNDVWVRRGGGSGLWDSPETRPFTWEHIAKKWGPLVVVDEARVQFEDMERGETQWPAPSNPSRTA